MKKFQSIAWLIIGLICFGGYIYERDNSYFTAGMICFATSVICGKLEKLKL